jgi:hypothetical protein
VAPPLRVAVSVLHWGSAKADTLACLRSVAASELAASPLIVVDNGTGAVAADEVEAAAPGAVLLVVDDNLGFAGGHNLAMRHALAAGADAVLLLNNDATLEPGCLGALARVAAEQGRVGAVGAKVLSADDPTRLWLAWGRVTYRAALVERVGRDALDGPPFDRLRDVEWVPGCTMLLTRAALEGVGFLDERFFAYHEDVDWCVRARRRGFRVLFAPEARAAHRGEGSLGGRGPANPARYLSARNSVLFARRHGRFGEKLLLAATAGGSLARDLARGACGGDLAVPRLLLRGYLDGLRDRPVPLRELGLR